MTTFCFTGPRPNSIGWSYDDENIWKSTVATIIDICSKVLDENGSTVFISGGAQGFDQCAAMAVTLMRRVGYPVESWIYLPFPYFGSNWLKNGPFSRGVLNTLLDEADRVEVINQREGSGFSEKCLNRNTAMLNDSDSVIALWDPSRSLMARGGTADSLRKATRMGKNIIYINPESVVRASQNYSFRDFPDDYLSTKTLPFYDDENRHGSYCGKSGD